MKPAGRRIPARRDDPRETAAGALPVIVPRLVRRLVELDPTRLRNLRRHLLDALRDLANRRDPNGSAPPPAERTGLAARVVGTACALCQGSCCVKGADDAYIDARTLARFRNERPELGAWGLIRAYTARVPADGVEGSCIFHGARGCTLDPVMRSDVCHRHFCYGLEQFLARTGPEEPVIVIAGDGKHMRRSAVLMPDDGHAGMPSSDEGRPTVTVPSVPVPPSRPPGHRKTPDGCGESP